MINLILIFLALHGGRKEAKYGPFGLNTKHFNNLDQAGSVSAAPPSDGPIASHLAKFFLFFLQPCCHLHITG